MVSKKLREGEADEGEGPPADGGGASKRKSKAVKKATVDSGLVSVVIRTAIYMLQSVSVCRVNCAPYYMYYNTFVF